MAEDTTLATQTGQNIGGAAAPDENPAKAAGLEKNFTVNFNEPLPQRATEFAKAYNAGIRKAKTRDAGRAPRQPYALVFERSFPPRLNMINFLQNLPNEEGSFLSVLDSGVITDKNSGAENFAVIMEQPAGKTLAELFTNNPAPDKILAGGIIAPLNEFLGSMAENRLMHGSINAGNIFFDPAREKVILGDCLATPCGYAQPAVYEPIDRALCHPLAKGDGNSSADFYALGVLVLFLSTGKPPMNGVSNDELIERLFETGAYGLFTQGVKLPTFVSELLKGLLADRSDRRWGYMQVDSWLRKKLSNTPPSMTREAMRGFTFSGKDYYSTRHLSYILAKDSANARQNLKTADLSRWVKHSILRPELAERFDTLPVGNRREGNGVLDDDDIGRITILLDPTGPFRLNGFALDIYGFGTFLSYGYAKGNRDFIQLIGTIFTSGLLQFWLDAVADVSGQEDVRYQDLPWAPRKILNLIRKTAPGFGMERVLYEMNPSLPCQSPLLGNEYVDDLDELLKTLDKIAKDKYESDPVDRHIAGFIAAKIDLREEIILKKLAEFPEVAQNPQILMLALLLAAQTSAKTKFLKGLSAWVSERLMLPLQSVKSHNIREEMIKNIRRAAREGSLQEIYKVTTNANYLKRDTFGFKEAAGYYRQLGEKIHFMSRNDNNEKLAYEYGLRYAMIFSYLLATCTLIYLLTRL